MSGMTETEAAAPADPDAVTRDLESLFSEMFTKNSIESDEYMIANMQANMSFPLEVIIQNPRVREITTDEAIVEAVLANSQNIELIDRMVRPKLRVEQHTIILRDIPPEVAAESILKIFENAPAAADGAPCPRAVSARSDMNNTWFVHFSTDAETRLALQCIRTTHFNGAPLKARLKTESLNKAFYAGGDSRFSPATPGSATSPALSPSAGPGYYGVRAPGASPVAMMPQQGVYYTYPMYMPMGQQGVYPSHMNPMGVPGMWPVSHPGVLPGQAMGYPQQRQGGKSGTQSNNNNRNQRQGRGSPRYNNIGGRNPGMGYQPYPGPYYDPSQQGPFLTPGMNNAADGTSFELAADYGGQEAVDTADPAVLAKGDTASDAVQFAGSPRHSNGGQQPHRRQQQDRDPDRRRQDGAPTRQQGDSSVGGGQKKRNNNGGNSTQNQSGNKKKEKSSAVGGDQQNKNGSGNNARVARLGGDKRKAGGKSSASGEGAPTKAPNFNLEDADFPAWTDGSGSGKAATPNHGRYMGSWTAAVMGKAPSDANRTIKGHELSDEGKHAALAFVDNSPHSILLNSFGKERHGSFSSEQHIQFGPDANDEPSHIHRVPTPIPSEEDVREKLQVETLGIPSSPPPLHVNDSVEERHHHRIVSGTHVVKEMENLVFGSFEAPVVEENTNANSRLGTVVSSSSTVAEPTAPGAKRSFMDVLKAKK